ncbi:MAG: sugar ABC transporter substrate-binding protein [Tannerellaceae bacterium]|nr:sugar ABC transporter substrate-binding protein [Tannerellaceae bacterium]
MKKTWIVLISMVFVLVLTGCGGPTREKSDGTIKVGISFHSMMNDVFTASENYLKEFGAASSPPVEFSVVVADNDISKQTADIKDIISKKPDVVAIVPEDSRAVEASIKDAHAANIPVVVYNRPVHPDVAEQPDCFVGIDSTDQGYASAKHVFQKMKDDGIDEINIVLVSGSLTDENSVNRSNGVNRAAKEFGANVLSDLPCDWDPELAAANLPAALKAYPQCNVVFVSSDCMIPGVQTTLEDAGRWAPYGEPNHVYIASCDVFGVCLPLIEEGYIDADSLFDIVTQSKETVRVIKELAAGNKVEPIILVKGPVYTPENVNDPEMRSLLW